MSLSTAIDASAVARVVGIKTSFKDLRNGNILKLPQRIAVVGQGDSSIAYATDKIQLSSAQSVGERFGFGSPLHLAARELFPVNGDGVGTIPVTFYPLEDDAAGVAAAGNVILTGTATESGVLYVEVGGVKSEAIVVEEGVAGDSLEITIANAINANVNMPVSAASNAGTDSVDITAKHAGGSGGYITVRWIGEVAGITAGVTAMSGGLVNPDVQDGLDLFGDVWETLVVNCLDFFDTTNLDLFQTFGEGRWGATTRKPCVVLTGNPNNLLVSKALTTGRELDRVNSVISAPGSFNTPWVIAARATARIAVLANNNPAHDYGSLPLENLITGEDSEQWTIAERDEAVKAGLSTTIVKNGIMYLSDVVTMYRPDGEAVPAYRHVVDIIKVMNIVFNLDLIFATAEWDGAPLIPDEQPTANRSAKKPRMAIAAICAMHDNLGLEAIISDPDFAKNNTFAEIASDNPKRLNVETTVKISGNTNIISIDLNFGFYFGTPSIVG